jgi:opacity protein-like surface antigen
MPNARLRPYVLGGLDAFMSSLNFGGTGIVLTNGDVDGTWGWHIGGGAEYRFTDNLGFFAEIRYRSADTDIEVTQWFSGIPALTTKDPLSYDGFVGTIGIKIYW